MRAEFHTGDMMITWYEEKANLVHYLYDYEHGQRLSILPRPPQKGGFLKEKLKRGSMSSGIRLQKEMQ